MKSFLPIIFLFFLPFMVNAQNNALLFDGQSEYLSVPHNNDYNIGNGFTIEAWIYANAWRDNIWQGSIVNKDNQSPDRGFGFRCGANGSLSFVMSAGNEWQEAFTAPTMNANQWHHVAVTVNNGTITLYIDGIASANNTFTSSPSHSTDMPINIGGSPGFSGRNFDGIIDEVRIWDVARTQQQIADNTTVDLTGSETGLVAYFPMNEGTGTTTTDISTNGAVAGFNNMDASNWVNGYALPDYDISVQQIYGIDVINMIDRPVKMSVDILNSGLLDISNIDLTVNVNGQAYNTETVTNSIAPGALFSYQFELPVDLIGLNDPVIEVVASHPNDQNALNNAQTLNITTGSSSSIIVSDKVLHKNGEQFNSIQLNIPNDLHRYEQVLLNIDLSCPTGGCGTWDVLSDLKAVTSSGTYEIARYITPYGIACGGWVVDITDFKGILGGVVEFRTTIQVYTETGWLVDMSIDLIDNNPADTYTKLSPLWGIDFQLYGEPTVSYDLPVVGVNVDGNTADSHVRMQITGHGQGNTGNAAEFFNANHSLKLNGSDFHNHNLWKADCASNPCSNQNGTWQFPRAGWCPGENLEPYIINTTSAATAGNSVLIDYELQNYTNLLNTGYNGSDHTQPFYKIYGYFVESSSTPYDDYYNLMAAAIDENITGNILDMVTLTITNDGFVDMTNYTVNIYVDNALVATETFNETIAAGATVNKTVTMNEALAANVVYTLFAEVSQVDDENPGDNVIKAETSTSTDDPIVSEYPFQISPNPTSDARVQLQYDTYWEGSRMQIFSLDGKLVNDIQILNTESIELPYQGMFIYKVIHDTEEVNFSGKIIYLK